MRGDSSWASNARGALIFGEAGGAAALSAFLLMEDAGVPLQDLQLIAQDQNPEARAFWATLGAHTVADMDEIPSAYLAHADVVPCDEHLRRRWPELRSSRSSTLNPHASKTDHHMRLSGRTLRYLQLPRVLPRAVARPPLGAGCKGLVITDPGALVTEYIEPAREYVIDCDTRTGLCCPRVTHMLRHGADTSVTLININHPMFLRLRDAAWEALNVLGISGLCNVQLIEDRAGVLWFIEASPRLSGSSRLNLRIGVNLWSGRDDRTQDGPQWVSAHTSGIGRDSKGNM